jgi:competence protein ComEC
LDLLGKSKQRLLKIKAWCRARLFANLTEPSASLAAGMILGDQRLISKEVQNDFSRSGLSHVVAISGMNMTLLAVFLIGLLVSLGVRRPRAAVVTILIIWLYVLLVGASASAVRAGALSTIFLSAVILGRLASLPRGLALAAVIMLATNPRLLRDDLGFQLSFMAFLAVAYLAPLLQLRLKRKSLDAFAEVVAMTVAAQLAVLPLLAQSFGSVSVIAPMANLFVLWTLAPIMIWTLFGLLLSFFVPVLGKGVIMTAGLLIGLDAHMAELFAGISWSSMSLDRFGNLLAVFYYAILFGLIGALRKIRGGESSKAGDL